MALVNCLIVLLSIYISRTESVCVQGQPCADCSCASPAGFCSSSSSPKMCAPWPSTGISCGSDVKFHKACTFSDGSHGGCECQGWDGLTCGHGMISQCNTVGGNFLIGPNGECGLCVPCAELDDYSAGNNNNHNNLFVSGHCPPTPQPIAIPPPSKSPTPKPTSFPSVPTKSPLPTLSPTPSPICPDPPSNPPTTCLKGVPCAACSCHPNTPSSESWCDSFNGNNCNQCAPWISNAGTCNSPKWHHECTVTLTNGQQIHGACECQGFIVDGQGPLCAPSGGNGLWCNAGLSGTDGSCGICVPCGELNSYSGGNNQHDPFASNWCPSSAVCGNGICESGENCNDCLDCGVQTGRKKKRWCCDPSTQTCVGRGCNDNQCVWA